ncbi:Uncharacterised protein [uncultured archaeon]|nr:Uncharacterised protein [uncultured archaeon]
MSSDIGLNGIKSDEILGLAEYYEAVLTRKGLITRESEFRSTKLGFILEFIRIIEIPEHLSAGLITTFIEAWRLQIPERTLRQRVDELGTVLNSINSIRVAANLIKNGNGSINGVQFIIEVIKDLPLIPSDLRSRDIPRIYDLLGQVRDYFCLITEKEAQPNFSL